MRRPVTRFMAEPVTTLGADGLPFDWQALSFEKCVLDGGIERKGSIPQGAYKPSGRFPVVDQGSSLIAGYTEAEDLVHRDDLPLILFGDHTRIFKFLDFPFATGADGTKLFRANEKAIDPKFLYYALVHVKIPSRGYNRHFKYLKEKTIWAPVRLDEQRAIAAVLSKIQKAVEVQERIVATLKELKAATMAKLFREGLRGEPLKQTEIGEIPESWEVVGFEECLEPEVRHVVGKLQTNAYASAGRYPIIDQGQTPVAGYTDDESLAYRGPLPVVIFGDHTRVFKFVSEVFVLGADGTKILHPNGNRVDARFFYYALTRLSIPSRGYNRHYKLLREQWLAIPGTIEEQRAIGQVLQQFDDRLAKALAKSETLKSLFSSMLNLLMTGQVRVKYADLKETPRGISMTLMT